MLTLLPLKSQLIHLRKFSRRGSVGFSPSRTLPRKRGPLHPHLSLHNDVIVKWYFTLRNSQQSGRTRCKELRSTMTPEGDACISRHQMWKVTYSSMVEKNNAWSQRRRIICMQTEFAEMSLGKFDVIIWTSSPSSVIVKGWKAAMASFKESKMNNEFTRLSSRQRCLSPLATPKKLLVERAKELFVTCRITCYKWEMTQLAN